LEERLRQEDELIVTDVEQFQMLQTGKHGRVERRDVVMSEQQLAKCSEPLEGAWSDALDSAVTEYQGTEAGELVVRGRRGVDARPLVDSVVGEVEGERDDGPDGRRDRAETADVAAHHPVVGAVARQRAGRGPSVFVALRRRGQLRDDESSQNYRQYRQPLDVTRSSRNVVVLATQFDRWTVASLPHRASLFV